MMVERSFKGFLTVLIIVLGGYSVMSLGMVRGRHDFWSLAMIWGGLAVLFFGFCLLPIDKSVYDGSVVSFPWARTVRLDMSNVPKGPPRRKIHRGWFED